MACGGGVWCQVPPGSPILPLPFGNGMTQSRNPKHRWSAAELAQLEDMLGNMPFTLLCRRWNAWAKAGGYPPRTERGLAHKANALGSRRSFGRWIGIGDVARALDRWPATIWSWSRRGWIRRYAAGSASAVHRGDLQELACNRPELFSGASREGLLQVLDDEELVDAILERHPKRVACLGGKRRVQWVDAGIVFPSIAAAARRLHVTESTIRGALLEQRSVCGHQLVALD